MQNLLGNRALVAGSLAVSLLVLEFVVCGMILVPDDLLENVTVNQVVRYKPTSRATFRHPDGRRSEVVVNAQGWNSLLPSYATRKPAGVSRIAIVGGSYVHGADLDREDHFAARLAAYLDQRGADAEVYRFGTEGAPLGQYLHVLRREVLAYKPDIVVIPLVHDDFDKRDRRLGSLDASSFMKLARRTDGEKDGDGHGVREIAPTPFEPGLADVLRRSAAVRYISDEADLNQRITDLVSRYFRGGHEAFEPEFKSSAVDIRKTGDHDANRFFARYVLAEIQTLGRANGFEVIFAMDGVREAIYAHEPAEACEVARLNTVARDLARELDLAFIDLHEPFAADFGRNGVRFEFLYDWHWNAHANDLVGRVIGQEIITRGWLAVDDLNAAPANAEACATGGAGCRRAALEPKSMDAV